MIRSDLPGADLIGKGVADLERRIESVEALLVSIGAVPLRALGIPVGEPFVDPERRLYHLLAATGGDGAHSQYNALVRRLTSFRQAAVCAR